MRITKVVALYFVAYMTMAAVGTLAGQQASDPPAAPIPAAILTAKKVFISNASGETLAGVGLQDLTYNEFYSEIKSSGRYDLGSSPADADLVFEIRYAAEVGQGGPFYTFYFRVSVLDPKTRVILWAFCEHFPHSTKKLKGRALFDQTMSKVVNDLKGLDVAASRAVNEQKK